MSGMIGRIDPIKRPDTELLSEKRTFKQTPDIRSIPNKINQTALETCNNDLFLQILYNKTKKNKLIKSKQVFEQGRRKKACTTSSIRGFRPAFFSQEVGAVYVLIRAVRIWRVRFFYLRFFRNCKVVNTQCT